MFYGNQVQDTRQFFFLSWQKYCQGQPLLPLEKQIVDVLLLHPEYHELIKNQNFSDQTYFPELGQTNPFLHMGLHLAIRDQIRTNRPAGISDIFTQLMHQYADESTVEHLLIERFAECLWQSQREQTPPNEQKYLDDCKSLLTAEK